jgi:hypothetical protein
MAESLGKEMACLLITAGFPADDAYTNPARAV